MMRISLITCLLPVFLVCSGALVRAVKLLQVDFYGFSPFTNFMAAELIQ
jgi:hypothetical protein